MCKHELHIDLLKCEHCGQHSKHLNFCAPCGRPRKTIIIAEPTAYKQDVQFDFRCRTCFAQSALQPWCHYCERAMKLQRSKADFSVKKKALPIVPERTQEDEDREWARICKARSKKKGKKPGNYQYGKDLATNMAAPFIARLRREAARNTFVP
jgi:hypothetical protein